MSEPVKVSDERLAELIAENRLVFESERDQWDRDELSAMRELQHRRAAEQAALPAVEEMVKAATHFDFPGDVSVWKLYGDGKWHVWRGDYNYKTELNEDGFKTFDAAYQAAIAAGWLPQTTRGMMKFRKKQVAIDAMQLTEKSLNYILAWGDQHGIPMREVTPGGSIIITTLDGEMCASVGDWIIKGIKGEFYPCKPDIFEATYERAP